jgi:hypothetical protein
MIKTLSVLAVSSMASLAALGVAGGPAHAGKGAAFLGGLIGGHVLTNMAGRSERRTQAAESQAYSQPPAQYQPAQPAPSSSKSVEQKLDDLNTLAAKGYISKEEYQARRKAILDSL